MKRLVIPGSLIAVILLSALISWPVFGAGEDGLAKAEQARQRHTDTLMAQDGVVGVALGHNPAGKPSVVVLTEKPGVAGIPRELDGGVPVHVRVTGQIFALDHCPGHEGKGKPPCDKNSPTPTPEPTPDPGSGTDCPTTTGKHRPACNGISTGHPDITAGTICCKVVDAYGNFYALSNNHVYADENLGDPSFDDGTGDPAIQPGTYDGGSSPADNIGTLYDFEPIVFSESANNVIDAAIVKLDDAKDLTGSTPADGYGVPKSTTVAPRLNQKVRKYGRTTGETTGQVYAVNATVNIGYDTGVARFVNQMIIIPGDYSAGGDSGSLIVVNGKGKDKRDDRKPVGLLFAGSPTITIANPIDDVLDRFGVTIVGE